jgi:hypothetical protein
MGRFLLAAATLILALTVASTTMASEDVVIFDNGDRLTGEVKSLERGKLRFDSPATGTIPVEWDNVVMLTSEQNIQVETVDGRRFLGRLLTGAEKSSVLVKTETGPLALRMEQVVFMTPIEETRLDRLDADLTAGYTFAKASEVQQLSFGLDMDFRTETRIFSLNADVLRSDSEDSESSQRQSLDLRYRHLRKNRWYTGAIVSLDRNDELDLDLRTSIGVGGGRYLRQTNSSTLSLGGGLQFSRENVSSGIANEDTVEGVVSMHWDWFRYDTPELDLTTRLDIIPNLTDSGRVRSEFDVSLRWEIIADLFWQLSFYDSYDSDPVVDGAEKNDFGVGTSLGWSF